MVWTIKEQSLCEAIKSGLVSRINKALQNGADVKAKNNDGWTPLMFALYHNVPKEVVELLLDKGADVNAKDNDDWTPLMYACGNRVPKEVVELLLDKGADVNAENKDGRTALTIAAIYNAPKEVTDLLIERIEKAEKQFANLKQQIVYDKLKVRKIKKQRMWALMFGKRR